MKFLQFLKQTSISVAVVGGVLVFNQQETGNLLLTTGGLGLAVYFLLSGFLPVRQEPDWTLVYPELAMGFGPDDGDELSTKNDQA